MLAESSGSPGRHKSLECVWRRKDNQRPLQTLARMLERVVVEHGHGDRFRCRSAATRRDSDSARANLKREEQQLEIPS